MYRRVVIIVIAAGLSIATLFTVALAKDRAASVARTPESLNIRNETGMDESLPLEYGQDRHSSVFSPHSGRNLGLGQRAPSVMQTSASNWHIERVDSSKRFGLYDRCLRLDSEDHPHIAYSGTYLYYARYDGTEWHREIVDQVYTGVAYTSLALDGMDRPHISYSSNGLKYAWHDGTTWHLETVDSVGVEYTSLALGGSGRPHISYGVSSPSAIPQCDLKYAWHDGTDWHFETVRVDLSYYCSPTSLALDGAGRPHISYQSHGNLEHAWYDGMDWHIETVEPAVNGSVTPLSTSLVLDESGRPHISYENKHEDALRYAWHDGTAWQIETVDRDRYHVDAPGAFNSLALDGAGRPHISYCDCGGRWEVCDKLKYAWHNGVHWVIETVNHGDCNPTSLALDGANRPHIGYHRGSTLRHTWYDGATWQIETVDKEYSVGSYASLALDRAGRPHISYKTSNGLKYAWHDGTDWHIERIERTNDCGAFISLALDRSGRPHIGYTCDYTVKYAWHDGVDWRIETVDSGRCTSLALDGSDRPHISYSSYVSGTVVKHAWHDGATWHIETVDRCSYSTSLAIDGSDRIHITYRFRNDLKYAWYDGTTWLTETVESSTDVYAPFLVLDGSNRPHISYVSNSVKHAWHDGATWHVERVDNGDYHTSLAIDGLGRPHIGYDTEDDALAYAWYDGVHWHTEIVDSKYSNSTISLVVDGSGRPHISYMAERWDLLKYATGTPLIDLSPSVKMVSRSEVEAGDTITYTIQLSNVGRLSSTFTLVDSIPWHVTYVPGSAWVSGGEITDTLGITWTGTISSSANLSATFAVTVDTTLTQPTAIVNTATLIGNPTGSLILRATSIVNGLEVYLPFLWK